MKTKTAILVPGTSGLHIGAYQAAKYAAKGKALVTSSLTQVEKYLKTGRLSKVIVIMGARGWNRTCISASEVYFKFKAQYPQVKCIVMDVWNWAAIPDMVLLSGKDTVKLISRQL